MIAAQHLVRLVQAALQWEFLSLLPGVSPVYLALTGLLWGLAGIPVVYGLWKGKAYAPWITLLFALAYALYIWFDLFFVADSDSGAIESPALPFKAAATVFLLLLTSITLIRRKAKAYFSGVMND